MIQRLKKLLLSSMLATLFFVPVLMPAVAHAADSTCPTNSADINACLKTGACLSASADNCAAATNGGQDSVNSILTTVINIFSLVVGVVAVIMIIIGGLKYITSGGESSNITGAKNTILYAIVGLVIVALAQVIVHFVLARVTVGQ